jgi:hypothetical protein
MDGKTGRGFMVALKEFEFYGKARFTCIVIVLWFFAENATYLCGVAFADEVLPWQNNEQYRWHARVGLQVAHQLPDFRYVPVDRSKVTAWNDNPDFASTSFSFFSLQRELTDNSNLELSYFSDGSDGKLYGEKKIGFFFLKLRDPLEINVRNLKLTWSRTLWKSEPFSFGASLSAQALQLSMNARLGALLESWVGFDHLDYLVVVPSVGAFAEYRTKGALSYRVSSEYMTVPLAHIEGKLIEVNARAEYRLTDRFFLGLGYRFSDRSVRLHQKNYDLNGSWMIHGYQLYSGFDF